MTRKTWPLLVLCIILLSCKNEGGRTDKTKQQENAIDDSDRGADNSNKNSEKGVVNSDTKDSFREVEEKKRDMVYFEGGEIIIGSEEGSNRNQPVFKKQIEPFYLDKTPVTVANFAIFVSETGYFTEAEKFGDSGIFDFKTGQWSLVKGVTWKHPLGPNYPEAESSHPVTHISWNDANAYAQWAGKRLPSEYEWECAARYGSKPGDKFPWGNQEQINGKYMANTWQGDNVTTVNPEDGYLYTSPVGVFGQYPSGLYDMSGNVWEWCSDIFGPYPESSFYFQVSENVKSIRGGSFMYDESGAESYSVYGRSFNSAETSLFNMGFRCAMN